MTRDEFIQRCALMGIGISIVPGMLTSCAKDDDDEMVMDPVDEVRFDGKVLIIGAGSAGLMAGYVLKMHNIDFQIIEASATFGGRVKKTDSFADFPIDLGAEWIHTPPVVLTELVNDSSVLVDVETITYNPQTISSWANGELTQYNWLAPFYSEWKFKNSTWFDFFNEYIVPSISEHIIYGSPVQIIDYRSNKVIVRTSDNQTFEGDKAIVTAPAKILQRGDIGFDPPLPQSKVSALDQVPMPPGIKVFMEFSERFYPDILVMGDPLASTETDEQLYYDAAFKKDSSKNILALFHVGESASKFTDLQTEQEIIDKVLEELDEIFSGQASQFYIKHVIQNWTAEPFVMGSYSHYQNGEDTIISEMQEPLANKVYFAGEAFTSTDLATVHGAGESGKAMAESILMGG